MSSSKTDSQAFVFFKQFISDFFHMGAILPSSRALGRAGAAYLAQKQGPARVLEVGSGTGAFTREILPLLDAGDSLDLVEINSSLMDYLKSRFENESDFQIKAGVQVNFINDDVRNLPANTYHYIIFSLPLTNFDASLVKEILDLMIQRLEPGGVFSYVKYIFLGRLKCAFSNATGKATMKAKQEIIDSFAEQYQIEKRAVMMNVPPTWVYYWQKPENS